MNLDRIEELVRMVRQSTVSEIAIQQGDYRLMVRKMPMMISSAAQVTVETNAIPAGSQAQALEAPKVAPMRVNAPMVGIFRLGKSPLEEGAIVEVCQTVGSIEVMKLPNEVRSNCDGMVAKVLVEDGQPVEYGQPLFELIPGQAGVSFSGGEGGLG